MAEKMAALSTEVYLAQRADRGSRSWRRFERHLTSSRLSGRRDAPRGTGRSAPRRTNLQGGDVTSSRTGGGLLDAVMRLVSAPVAVHVDPQVFVFSSSRTTLSLATFLYLHDGPDGVRVLSVGEEVSRMAGVVRLDLFGEDKRLGKGRGRIGKAECLEAFARYALHKLAGRTAMVRPSVTVSNVRALDPVLRGFQFGVLKQAFEVAGASSVTFDEREVA